LLVLAGQLFVQVGGQGTLSGQVIFQRQNPPCGSQRVVRV
jgi:hypothetical protein